MRLFRFLLKQKIIHKRNMDVCVVNADEDARIRFYLNAYSFNLLFHTKTVVIVLRVLLLIRHKT